MQSGAALGIEETGRLHGQIVGAAQRRGEGPVDLEAERLCRAQMQLIAQLGEADEAVEQVIAVGAPSDHMEIEIDLGPRPKAEGWAGGGLGRRAQPPLPFGSSPCWSFASMGATRSASGLKASARCHWKRASLRRPSFQ